MNAGRRRGLAVVAALAVVLAGSPGSSGAAGGRELRDRAEREGVVRVIVRLAGEGAPARRGLALRPRRASLAQRQEWLLAALPAAGDRRARRLRRTPFVALDADPATLAALERSPLVASVEEDRLLAPALAQSVPLIGAAQAHADGTTGSGVGVAILDTGVDAAHPFLAGRVVAEACFSANRSCPNGASAQIGPGAAAPCGYTTACFHGTHVAGIAAGSGSSLSGVAPGASLVAVQVFSRFTGASCAGAGSDPCALAYTSDLVAGLEHVLDLGASLPIAAANLSVGGGAWTSQAACDLANPSLKAGVDALRAAGVATVAAAGNEGRRGALAAPACLSSAIGVGATDDADAVAPFSNSAPFLSFFAPGTSITSSIPPALFGFGWGIASGTSMATPHVSGALALLRERAPAAGVDELVGALRAAGVPVQDGSGAALPRLALGAALQALSSCADSDADGDGVCDDRDTCLAVADPSQADSDLDGFGDACDADYDQTGLVGAGDFNLMREQLGRRAGEPGFDPRFDHDGDGAIGSGDFNLLRSSLASAPGPSGLACAGSPPCGAP
jgi:subtilisin family serine protease